MIIKRASFEKIVEAQKSWHNHFAWWPVRVSDDQLVWLATVQRRKFFKDPSVKFGRITEYEIDPALVSDN